MKNLSIKRVTIALVLAAAVGLPLASAGNVHHAYAGGPIVVLPTVTPTSGGCGCGGGNH